MLLDCYKLTSLRLQPKEAFRLPRILGIDDTVAFGVADMRSLVEDVGHVVGVPESVLSFNCTTDLIKPMGEYLANYVVSYFEGKSASEFNHEHKLNEEAQICSHRPASILDIRYLVKGAEFHM